MTGIRSYLAVLCAMLVAAPAGGYAADPPQQQPATANRGIVGRVTGPYRPVERPENNL